MNGGEPTYWVYRTHAFIWRGTLVQAKLLSPSPHSLVKRYAASGFRSPMQDEPYNVKLDLVYQINPKHPWPDNYLDSFGFSLYSERLVELMDSFGVKSEVFPVTLVDKHGTTQRHVRYFVFHSLEGVLDAMDEERSEWTGDYAIGIPRLVLDSARFPHRPIFKCNHIYVPLMRNDLKREIQQRGITGFDFLDPARYRSGSYGFPPEFES